ncbi:MAG: IclR family transcriptional regulator [Acidiferrobacterales bacterium]|nr:IclR family transcriptional regulator [Acidiferrobacterales bacterium]
MINSKLQTDARARGSALEKALVVLDAVVENDRSISLAELTEKIDMPKQSIHRVLQSLEASKLIIRAISKDRYLVGPALTDLSARALRANNSRIPLKSVLADLVSRTGETCNVGILDQSEVVYIERLEGSFPLRLQLDVGSRVPFHCTAIGKLLVAHQHKNIRTRLLRVSTLAQFTAQTQTSVNALEQDFAGIRSRGYSYNNQEYVDGLTALAVPLTNSAGKISAGLAIHGPASRLDQETALTFLPLLKEKAEQIQTMWSENAA